MFDFSNLNNCTKPFPDPPLAAINIAKAPRLKNISKENWNEGTDSKRHAYTWIRNEKEKMFDQNKEWTKFRTIFRGLHRTMERAKKPNKITEYDLPVNIEPKVHFYTE